VIKLIVQPIDYTTPNTIQRDIQSLEESANTFMRNPNIVPITVRFQEYPVPGLEYMAIMVEYNIKRA